MKKHKKKPEKNFQLFPTFIKTWTHLKFLVVCVGLHPKAHWNPNNTNPTSHNRSLHNVYVCMCARTVAREMKSMKCKPEACVCVFIAVFEIPSCI